MWLHRLFSGDSGRCLSAVGKAVIVIVAAAEEENKKDDDYPAAVASADTVVVAVHKKRSFEKNFFRVHYSGVSG